MKKITFFSFFYLLVLVTKGQVISAENILTLITLSKTKTKSYLLKNGYVYAGREQFDDTVLSRYVYRNLIDKRDRNFDSVIRSLYRADAKESFFINYQTTSLQEVKELVKQFKKKGFFCNESTDSLQSASLLFQHNDITVRTSFSLADSIKSFNIQVQKKIFTKPKYLYYADDLLSFNSHEYLVYYFGKNNVKNDVYYFSGNEIARCSVLYLNTKRQVVFIWKDEVNKCTIDHLLFGGQQKLESSKGSDGFIAENNWVFKSGIRAGMSLFELRKLNGNDFKFYGGNSAFSGSVMTDKTGLLNFSKENIILGCMNCKDDAFLSATIINADDAIADGRILFVLSIILNAEDDTGLN